MIKLEGTRPIFDKAQYLPIKDVVKTLERPRERLIELLVKIALDPADKKTQERWDKADKEWELKLLRSPVEFLAGSDGQSVEKIKLAVNVMDGDSVRQTEEIEEIETGLVLRSIGYKSVQAEQNLPFDFKKGVIPNTDGRAGDGLYAAGWLGTGPRGVIIDTMNTAFKVGANVVEDLKDVTEEKPGLSGMPELNESTTWDQWTKLDQIEEEAGQAVGKLREKIISVPEMLN